MLTLLTENLKNITLYWVTWHKTTKERQNQSKEKDVSKTMTHNFPQNFYKNNKRHCFVRFYFRNNFS